MATRVSGERPVYLRPNIPSGWVMPYPTMGVLTVLTRGAQPDVIDSPAIRLQLHLLCSAQPNEVKEYFVPGKSRAAHHQLLKLTLRSVAKVSEDPIGKDLLS